MVSIVLTPWLEPATCKWMWCAQFGCEYFGSTWFKPIQIHLEAFRIPPYAENHELDCEFSSDETTNFELNHQFSLGGFGFKPKFRTKLNHHYTVDICLDHVPPHQRDLDATMTWPKWAETQPKQDVFEVEIKIPAGTTSAIHPS